MKPEDLDQWPAQEPSPGFADRVVTEAKKESRQAAKPPRKTALGVLAAWRPNHTRAAVGLLLVASMAAAVAMALHLRNATARGDVTADARREVRVGARAIAVLEPGAHVRWSGDGVEQDGGDVFWRVEPGARFVVHTAAADVTVKGTCFRVKLAGEDTADEADMNRRDVMAGAIGAAAGVAAFVGVYEGKVAVSRAGQSVDLVAGQSAQVDAAGVHATGDPASSERAFDKAQAAAEGSGGDPLLAANANLADTVRDYRRRLDSISAEKQKLEKKLADAEARLGDAGSTRSPYDLTPDDLKALAKEGEVRIRVPCAGPRNDFSVSPGNLRKLGLAPQDAPVIQAALQQSNARTWGVIRPLCSQALGDANVDRIGQTACVAVLQQLAEQQDNAAYTEAVRQVAEIEAGTRPVPGPGDSVLPIERAYLALAGESRTLQADLTQSLGPDDARRFAFGDEGCWWNSSHGVGPRDGE
jgi:ferric-dicitrate binding protein FerR (iron transport regulator)